MKRWARILLGSRRHAALVAIKVFVNQTHSAPHTKEQRTTRSAGRKGWQPEPLAFPRQRGRRSQRCRRSSSAPSHFSRRRIPHRRLAADLDFLAALNLRSFQIESPQIRVIRAANGTWNFSSLGLVRAGPPGPRVALTPTPLPKFKRFRAGHREPLCRQHSVIEDGPRRDRRPARAQQSHRYDRGEPYSQRFLIPLAVPIGLDANLPPGWALSK